MPCTRTGVSGKLGASRHLLSLASITHGERAANSRSNEISHIISNVTCSYSMTRMKDHLKTLQLHSTGYDEVTP